MTLLLPHLIVAPVVLPLLTAAVLLLLGERRRRLQSILSVVATVTGLLVAVAILIRVDAGGGRAAIDVYLASNWEAPFGIVLVADRLSALMLVLVGCVSVGAALYAEGGWGRVGVYFHPLFQLQLMGLNGAFLTGDLFNLFVFFEVLLAASYGLQLHGSGWPRVRSGLQYIAVNLLASSLFLIGLAVLYGVMGTLSMADIASKTGGIPAHDLGLFYAGSAILAVAFLVKAAIWPLNAWLVPAYAATSAPVAALFALMTKVGIYAILRLWSLFFPAAIAAPTHFGASALLVGGLATIAFGTVGLLASIRISRIAGFSIIVSSGTLLTAFALRSALVTGAALYYVLSATLAVSAIFLIAELARRGDTAPRASSLDAEDAASEDTNLDDEEAPLIGRAFRLSLALMGLGFICCAVLIAGLPPLSGFIAKVALLSAIVTAGAGPIATPMSGLSATAWTFVAMLLLSGLVAMVSLARAGVRHFWSAGGSTVPQVKVPEALSLFLLLFACGLLTVYAEPVLRYTRSTAAELYTPATYVDTVLATRARPAPARSASAELSEPP